MRYLILSVLFLGIFIPPINAQNGERIQERIRAQRVAVYTDVLDLSAEEAQVFWPVYNQYLDEREAIQKEQKSLKKGVLSDTEAEAKIKKHIELQQRELDLEKDLVQKLRKVISVQKIAQIPEAERQFRQSILERVQARAEKRKGN